MKNTKYFPEGVALGSSFVNRERERADLLQRVQVGKHTVFMAPRRYGKTSLVLRVADEGQLPFSFIDLLTAYDVNSIRKRLLDKVGKLVFDLLPTASKAKEKLIEIFKKMNPEISFGQFGFRLKLQVSNDPLQDITDILLKLDETAGQFDKRAIVFIDEFQQISQLKDYKAIEASIRHAVERSQYIAYVFSGSNRHLLEQIFGDQSRPLYRLCQLIGLERISEGAYTKHLQSLAKERWQGALELDTLKKIFELTKCHPFYMNVLCQILWEQEHLPDESSVEKHWRIYVEAQRAIVSHDVMELSLNQRKIMIALAQTPVAGVQSSEFTSPLSISPSSAQQAVEVLLRKDMIYRDSEKFYQVLDPAVSYYLNFIAAEIN